MTRVALIDDHESVRLGLEAACARAVTKEVVFSAAACGPTSSGVSGRGGARRHRRARPHARRRHDGHRERHQHRRRRLAGAHPQRRRSPRRGEALAAGAAGVISKASRIDDVIAAIRTVARGEALDNVEWASAVDGDRAFADAQLSNRERDVLRLYAAGLPLKAVADRLGIAYSTAKENITRVRTKYVEVGRPAPTKVDLLRRAMEDGLMPGHAGATRGDD
jgi:DNA-binding NarL/FixJ family response regulator